MRHPVCLLFIWVNFVLFVTTQMTHFVQNGKEKVEFTFSKLVSIEARCMWRLCYASCLEILPFIPTLYIQYANRKILHCSLGTWNMKVMPFELLLVGTFRTQVLNPDIRGKYMQNRQ